FEGERLGRHLHGLVHLAWFEHDIEVVVLVHLDGDGPLLKSLESRQSGRDAILARRQGGEAVDSGLVRDGAVFCAAVHIGDRKLHGGHNGAALIVDEAADLSLKCLRGQERRCNRGEQNESKSYGHITFLKPGVEFSLLQRWEGYGKELYASRMPLSR